MKIPSQRKKKKKVLTVMFQPSFIWFHSNNLFKTSIMKRCIQKDSIIIILKYFLIHSKKIDKSLKMGHTLLL